MQVRCGRSSMEGPPELLVPPPQLSARGNGSFLHQAARLRAATSSTLQSRPELGTVQPHPGTPWVHPWACACSVLTTLDHKKAF